MIIKRDRSIIPACDVSLSRLEELAKITAKIDQVGAYKLGFVLGLSVGLSKAVEVIRRYTDKPIIYDHQKGATDIPSTGQKFASVCKDAGINAVIFFPQSGPVTQREWIDAARNQGLGVIVGGSMTHPGYKLSEGGYISDEAIDKIYLDAANEGVTDFVMPGTKPEEIRRLRKILENAGVVPTIYSPGLGAQGGDIAKGLEAAGSKWHPIIGRAIYDAPDIRKAVVRFVEALEGGNEQYL
ncbi:MAG: orotidine 5'-phosphate decarboxylase / HUMPS family protein [Pseudomonadota bacterium]